jgi:hypothetical protein
MENLIPSTCTNCGAAMAGLWTPGCEGYCVACAPALFAAEHDAKRERCACDDSEVLGRAEVRGVLRNAITDAGSLRAFARQHGISAAYVSDVMNWKREPGPKVLRALCLKQLRITTLRYAHV